MEQQYNALKDIWRDIQGAIDRVLLSLLEGVLLLLGIVVLVLVLPRCIQDLNQGIQGCFGWIREHPREVSQWLAIGRIFFFLYGLTSFLGSLDDIWNDLQYHFIEFSGGCPHCYGLTLSGEQHQDIDIDKNIRIREGETYLQGFDTWKSL
jgi:hypothetical protein